MLFIHWYMWSMLFCMFNDTFPLWAILSIWFFFHKTFTTHRTGSEGGGQFLHALYEHLDMSRVITAKGSPLHTARDRNRVPLVSERKSLFTRLGAVNNQLSIKSFVAILFVGTWCTKFLHFGNFGGFTRCARGGGDKIYVTCCHPKAGIVKFGMIARHVGKIGRN